MNLKNLSDSKLVNLYCTGSDDALSVLIYRYQEKIYTSIYLLVRNEALAEDIFQDTFIKVIEILRRKQYNDEGKFLPWVMRIAHNLCVDYFRKIKRVPKIVTTEGYDIFEVLPFVTDQPEVALQRNQTVETVRQLLDQLPEEQREIVILRHYANLSFKEIAAITNISINTALGRMRYALLNIRKMIAEKQIAL